MAAPASSTRMRLTVVVEALAEENAHGEYRDMALAAFKERRFAMPVQLDQTFEMVWADIEQRYKTNYLAPHQAAAFCIKKLQDAYECDLDMTDTVGAIFEGEPDRKMHMIRVIPHFIFRETSVVPGSMLRPQKRLGDDMDSPGLSDSANVNGHKRRRVESLQRQSVYEARIPSPNRPIPSTEALPASTAATAAAMDTDARSVRSRSGLSFVETSRKETGQHPFGANHVKQESPKLAEPVQSSYTAPQVQSQQAPQPLEDDVPAVEDEAAEHAETAPPEHTSVSQRNPHEAAIHQSPISSDEGALEQEIASAVAPARTTRTSRDVYRVPSLSPDFMHKKATPDKPGKTYGRSPHTGADLLNMARRLGRTHKEADATQIDSPASISRRAQAFQRLQPDEIESTPQENAASGLNQAFRATTNHENDDDNEDDLTASFLEEASAATPSNTQVSAHRKSSKPVKPGSLKKPSRASLTHTPMVTKRGAKSKFAATPVSIGPADRTGTKSTAATPASVASSKVGNTPEGQSKSRLERLQLLLSQDTPAGQGNKGSAARSSGHKSRERSSRSSPEVRIPGTTKNAPVIVNAGSTAEPLDAHQATKQNIATEGSDTSPQRAKHLGSVAKATPRVVDEGEIALPQTFKKPARTIRDSPAQPTSTRKASAPLTAGLPRRSEIPLPPNVRHLRRSSSLQSSPLAKGITGATDVASSAPSKPYAKPKEALHPTATTLEDSAIQPIEQSSSKDPINDAIIISSAEPSSTDYSSSEDGEETGGRNPGTNAVNNQDVSLIKPAATVSEERLANDTTDQPESSHSQREPDFTPIIPDTQEKPPSGQNSDSWVPWNSATWNFGNIDKMTHQNSRLEQEQDRKEEPLAATNTALAPEDEGFADQEVYSTAIEDNISKSHPSSAAGSTRSSPAVSRRPARFLSHSPTPDTSESEDDSDEASAAAARATSTQTNGKDESDSESNSSTDSSDDEEDVEMTEFPPESTSKNNALSDPPSSPPLGGLTGSTPTVPATSQAVSSQMKPPVQRTPVPPPTQQSSQAPRSSQSVSVQAADRRRYTGFRSLREQLADTKTAQAATQKKVFDPRTMSLGKLTKGKPFTSLEQDDESSDDESSSSSSSSDSD